MGNAPHGATTLDGGPNATRNDSVDLTAVCRTPVSYNGNEISTLLCELRRNLARCEAVAAQLARMSSGQDGSDILRDYRPGWQDALDSGESEEGAHA